jgi:hypothetical protein
MNGVSCNAGRRSCNRSGNTCLHFARFHEFDIGALGVLALLQDQSFWRHHIGVLIAAFLIVSLSRLIGAIGEPSAIWVVLLQSLVLVTVAFPLQTTFAVLAARYCTFCSIRTSSLIGCVLAAVPSTAISMNALWITGLAVATDGTREAFWQWLRTAYPAALVLHASLGSMLWMLLSFPWWQSHYLEQLEPKKPPSEKAGTSTHEHETSPEFLRRLSPKAMGQLWALSAERHYVRVTTDAGAELLLMRLSDAVEQCGALKGLQIHRSHWVHQAGIKRLIKTKGRICVELKNGKLLPVSRSNLAAMAKFADDIGLGNTS